MNPNGKYKPFPAVSLPDRKWPNQTVTVPPTWCSVDLRDGNQALPVPMTVEQKLKLFDCLVQTGFKQIEVGFPASSPTEYEFMRRLIDEKRIPDDVTIQVLVQSRRHLIGETIKSIIGAKRVIVHLYNSTSPVQRRVVFGMNKAEIIALAVDGVHWIKECASIIRDTEIILQYSPESFSATEVEFALEICEAVMNEWQPTSDKKMIINLPCTVEVAMPNVYADQVEWFSRNMTRRNSAIISVHTHNDRGTGVASTELAMLAGADRVEGTLFGNGERTGNVDIITVALNLYTQGIDPGLDLTNLDAIRRVYENCTGMTVPDRHPYSGELVFTAFSGSHQDAIRKGLNLKNDVWEVPYLIIDPRDIGRQYSDVIRVNGQSGKGGIAYLLERGCGIKLPNEMIREFGSVAGKAIDALGKEVSAEDLRKMLWEEYIDRAGPYKLEFFQSVDYLEGCSFSAIVSFAGTETEISGEGNGPIDAFIRSLREKGLVNIRILDQAEHALGEGAGAQAIGYAKIQFPDGEIFWGAGVDTSIPLASVRAIISALNRFYS